MKQRGVAVLMLITCVVVQRSWQQRFCRLFNSNAGSSNTICELLNRRSSLRPRIINEPNSVTTTVDQESSETFICEAAWLRIGFADSICFCEFSSLDFESPEDLTRQLGLSLEWEIDGTGSFISTEALTPTLIQRGITISTTCIFNAEQLFHLLDPNNERVCEQSITIDMIPRCTSTINITRQVANNNIRLQCSVQPSDDQCEDGEYKRTSTSVALQLQGLLDQPPGLRVQKLNSTTLYLSWNAPDTLRGIPISNYSVDIDNLVTVSTVTVFASVNQPSIDPNTTSLDLSQVGSIGYLYDPGCESLRFTVRAWNSVGEGASSVVLYTQESLHNIKTYTAPLSPGVLCILCEFNVTSEAQGCEATIMEEAMTHQTSTIRDIIFNMTVISDGGQGSMPIEAFDCISNLPSGNFTIQVREVECSGGIGLREFIRQHIRLQGLDRQPDVSTNTVTSTAPKEAARETEADTQAIGFSVAIGILSVIGVLLLVILIIVARKQKNNREVILKDNKGHQGNVASQPISQQQGQSREQELLYDNDINYNIRPKTDIDPPQPTAEYSYTTITHSRQQKPSKINNNNGIEMNSCATVAYGTTA